ncbi:MAG: RNA polymerase sigma factor [Dongiaceae bacterium]
MHSLGLLLERYRPRLYASALALTGHRPEAEDAVHDTFVTALVRLQELRDHASVGGWLHAILRNNCLMAMRRNRQRAGPEETEICFRALKEEALVESRIESRQLRDWIWAVLEQLPEAQRVTVMLRYFGSHDSYDELAAILSVPVGTVRSRLSEAKIKLATLLRDAANIADSRPKQVLAEREAFYAEAFQSLNRGDRDSFLGHYADDLQLLCSGIEQRLGHAEFAAEVDDGLYAGVRTDLIRVLASGDLTVLEGAFVNPPENPLHCPPGIVLVLFQRDGFVRRVHLHLTPRPPLPAA